MLRTARAQIEEFNYDSAYKLLVRVLNTPYQPAALAARANTLFALNELNRVPTAKAAARGALLEALRLEPQLTIDSLAHLHSDAKLVFAEALELAPPATKMARAAAANAAPASAPERKASAPKAAVSGTLPADLPARYLTVRERDRQAVMDLGLYEKTPNVLDPACVAFTGIFWDVMGHEIVPPRLCAMSAALAVQGKPTLQLINYTRIVRKRDGAIEADTRAAPEAEWFNEVTGKRLQFNILGNDKILVTDLTPMIQSTPMPPPKADTVVTFPPMQGDKGTYYLTRFETRGAILARVADSLPLALGASHPHRPEPCKGTLTFDGDAFRYESKQAGGHTFRFTIDNLVSGRFSADGGSLRVRAGREEQLVLGREDWRRLYSALVTALRR
ncbi:MAG: hypothetical protein AABZ80_08585 [Gemmatimonadota bacterium]